MTTDEFFAHVESHGFSGFSPSPRDPMADCWARTIGDLFERTAEAAKLGRDDFRHRVWLVWQWLYCELAGCRSRVIASPPACRAAGLEIGPDVVSKACELLLLSQDY